MVNNAMLKTKELIYAYLHGYFPMPDPETGEIMWLYPQYRAIFPLEKFHCSKSLRRDLRKTPWQVTINRDFLGVMKGCQRPDTWITAEFLSAYSRLHQLGFAHSVEVYLEGELVGGTYGVSLGGAFFAESMFHKVTNASKVALYFLVERMKKRQMTLLEAQFLTPHLESLGATQVNQDEYLYLLQAATSKKVTFAEPQSMEQLSLSRP